MTIYISYILFQGGRGEQLDLGAFRKEKQKEEGIGDSGE